MTEQEIEASVDEPSAHTQTVPETETVTDGQPEVHSNPYAVTAVGDTLYVVEVGTLKIAKVTPRRMKIALAMLGMGKSGLGSTHDGVRWKL